MITEIEDYFDKGCGRCPRFSTADCSTRMWNAGLRELRRICLAAGLVETVKWGHPCYMHADRNVAIIGAFRENFRLTFFNAALLEDPDGVLERQGANTAHPDAIRFTANGQPTGMEPVIRACLDRAMRLAASGVRPPREDRAIAMPDELSDALDFDPELAEAFHRLTPGRQKSYLVNLNSARQSQTRVARIARFRDRIIAGKGALDR